MSISPASPPSTRPSLSISSPQKLRIQESKQAIQSLEKQISKEINGSYAFTGGRQERDAQFEKLFSDFFRELRGPEPLINETAQMMADRFIERSDISYSYTPCENPFQTLYGPNPELALALESIIEKEYGLQDQFLEALDSNGRQLSSLELEDRDTQYRDYYIVCRLFPRYVDTLRAIFKDLLIVEWLRQDSGQYRPVRADNEEIALLWQVAKQSAEDQKVKDAKLSERHWQDFKTDLYQTASSGALSLATKKPQFVASQVAKLGMNVIGRQVDPEGRNKWIKGFNMLGSVAVSKAYGGNTRDLITSLSVDVAELAQRPENTSKEKALLRGYASALAKGALSLDTKKLTTQILGFVASKGAEILPKADKGQSFKSEAYRALRATATNTDIHGHFIDKGVERYFREPEKPTPQLEEISQVEESKEPLQAFDGQWIEDVFNEKLSQIAVEEQVAIEKAQEINQKIDQLKKEINQQDEAIRIGKEHLNNCLNKSVDYVDDAHYEVKKGGDYWVVYRDGVKVYSQIVYVGDGKEIKKYCEKMIPSFQRKYGRPAPTQESREAEKALNMVKSKKAELVETLGELQNLPPPVEMRNKPLYLKLVEEQDQNNADLFRANQVLETKRQALEQATLKEEELHAENRKIGFLPKPKVYEAWRESEKDKENKSNEYVSASNRVAQINEKIYNNSKAQLEASVPKNPVTERDKELVQAIDNLNQKDANVSQKEGRIKDKVQDYNDHYRRDKYHDKLEKSVKDYNSAVKERDNELNHINALQGVESHIETPDLQVPKKAGMMEKAVRWGAKNVQVNTYQPARPYNYDPEKPVPPPSNRDSIYAEGCHQVNLARSEMHEMETTQSQSRGNWGEVQSFQNQQIFQENMSFKSAQQAHGTAQHEISQHSANMGALWGNGVARNVQYPPVSTGQAIESGIRELIEKPTLMQQVVRGFFNPDMGHLTPNERIEQNSQIFSAHAKPIIKGAGNLIDQLRSFGMLGVQRNEQGKLELSYDRTFYNKFSEWVDGKLPTVDSRVELVASVANEFVLQSFLMPFFAVGRARPLTNRVLANPETFGRKLRAIQAMQNPVHRSGVGNPWTEMFPMQPKKLAGISVAKIEPKMIQAGKGINRSNNHQFVTWIEKGQTRTASIGEMSHAGTFHDRGGLTKAGRALDKKASRVGSVFPKPKGNVHEINAQGQKVLDEILNHPDKQVFFKKVKTQRYREGIDIRLPDGRGARFTKDGKEMIGFLEPRK